ncbi:hypothetical protein JHK85_029862 [Glycine max]|nr:hypothetical protein JHK85_029862 [Glycine max]
MESQANGVHSSKHDDDGRLKRRGTWLTATSHIVTAVIGSGVLSLAWAVAQLGWIAGPAILTIFSVITVFTSSLLSDCYRYPDSVHGTRNHNYREMELSGLSIIAAVMSFGYSSIGIGLSIAKIAGGNDAKTSLTGLIVGEDVTSQEKLWNTFQAIGNIAFAYAFSQDTLKSSPPENQAMKKATLAGCSITSLFYMLCGLLGYAAFGNKAPGNFLTGFGFYEPYWLVDIGNVFVFVHLVGAYQVFTQPVFQLVETWVAKRWPESNFMGKEYRVGKFRFNGFRMIWRTVYVIFTAVVAMILPFFNSIVGLLGAISFFPLTVYFPTEMYLVQAKVPKFSLVWIGVKILSGFCLIVTLVAAAGSIQGIIADLRIYEPFK